MYKLIKILYNLFPLHKNISIILIKNSLNLKKNSHKHATKSFLSDDLQNQGHFLSLQLSTFLSKSAVSREALLISIHAVEAIASTDDDGRDESFSGIGFGLYLFWACAQKTFGRGKNRMTQYCFYVLTFSKRWLKFCLILIVIWWSRGRRTTCCCCFSWFLFIFLRRARHFDIFDFFLLWKFGRN